VSSVPSSAAPDEMLERVAAIAACWREVPGPLLELLHEVQETLGFIPPAGVPVIASALNLSRAEVHGVVSFYHYFRTTPPGRHVVRICEAEACLACGAGGATRHAAAKLGQSSGVGVETVYCLGLCACAPAVMINGNVHGRITRERLDELLDELLAGGTAEATGAAP
jgi:formate dehydrogenase subunit gamma